MKTDINNYLHRFSKQVAAEGQNYQSQAEFRSGHNVDYCTVRSQDIPQCQHRQILLTDSGEVKDIYSNILKFWNRKKLTVYPNTNGQTYYLADEQGQLVSDFIDPSDMLIDGRQLSRGYTPFFFGKKSGSSQFIKISPVNYQFQAYNGILSFKKGCTPSDMGFQEIYIQAFQYIGKKVKQTFKDIKQLMAMNLMLIQQINSTQLVIQPYKFSTANMKRVWETPRPVPGAFNRFGKQIWSQKFGITIPGYVFQVTQLAGNSSGTSETDDSQTHMAFRQNGVIIPDMQHIQQGNERGSTYIQIQLQINAGDSIQDTGDGKCILGYYQETDVITSAKVLKLKTGQIQFIASAFKRRDNRKIQIMPQIQMTGNGDNAIQISPQLKHKLLVQQYEVDFTPGTVEYKSQELFDELYQRRNN